MATVSRQAAAQVEALFASALSAQGAGRLGEAAALLGQASQAGHVGAMTLLGGQLLFGRGVPPDPQRGLDLLLRAANLGGGAACARIAALAASGVIRGGDWTRALDYLQRAAEGGHLEAQEQLKLLADPSGGGAKGRSWAQLRRDISLDEWRRPPALQEVSAEPVIRAVDGFVSEAVCDWLIRNARERLQPATVTADDTADEVHKTIRTNSHAGFDLMTSDVVVILVRERLAAAAGVEVRNMEAPQALHYTPGQEYRPHFDFLRPEFPAHAGALASIGQRTLTLLLYLNDGYEGGQTDFPTLGLTHRGRTGGLLMFRNVDAEGRPDRRMLHAGLAPTSGEKWLLSQWVRDRPQF